MEKPKLEKISKLGNIGQEVKVKDGFARNYLIPNKKALRASKENRNLNVRLFIHLLNIIF